MEEKDLLELIDEYLLGRIRASDLARLEYLRSTNPDIDLQVMESIKAFQVLQYVRYKELRQKLHQIDALDAPAKRGSIYRRWIIGGTIFILLLLGIWIWAIEHFSRASLAERNFEYVSADVIWHGDIMEEEAKNWELACLAFKDRDFRSAIILFQPFLENPENIASTNARWNILLARLGLDGPGLLWKEEMRQFGGTARDPFKTKAATLLFIVDSPFYHFFILQVSPQLSALKPRLM